MRRPPPLDLAMAVGLVALVVAETLRYDSAPSPVLRAALAAVTVSAVALRRTAPAAAAVVFSLGMTAESLATESPDETGILIAILLISYSLGAHLPRREALLTVGLTSMALVVTIATDPSDSVSNIPLSVALFVGLPFGLGTVVRRRGRDVAALTLRTEALTQEANRAVDAERRRIARELHDVVSHAVTLIAVQAEAGQAVMDDDPASARRSLESIGQVSREALNELSRLLAVLDDGSTVEEAGLARLGTLVAGVRATGMRVELTEEGERELMELDPATDRCAYRVVQEALTNALRHTSGGRVQVRVVHADGQVVVEVASEGRPHRSSYGGSGRGLAGLRERVLALGGSFEAAPTNGGFVVRAELPGQPLLAGR
jgi:signal transduction histidine kinase